MNFKDYLKTINQKKINFGVLFLCWDVGDHKLILIKLLEKHIEHSLVTTVNALQLPLAVINEG